MSLDMYLDAKRFTDCILADKRIMGGRAGYSVYPSE
jgi:hypothetical protein